MKLDLSKIDFNVSNPTEDVAQYLFPSKEKLMGNEFKYLVRWTTMVAAAYAFYRPLMPSDNFKMTRFADRQYPLLLGSVHEGAKLRSMFQRYEQEVKDHITCGFAIYIVPDGGDARDHFEKMSFEFCFDDFAFKAKLANGKRFVLALHNYKISEFFRLMDSVKVLAQLLRPLPEKFQYYVGATRHQEAPPPRLVWPGERVINIPLHELAGHRNMINIASVNAPLGIGGGLVVTFASAYFEGSSDEVADEIRKYDEHGFPEHDEYDYYDPSNPPKNPPAALNDGNLPPKKSSHSAKGAQDSPEVPRRARNVQLSPPPSEVSVEIAHSPPVKKSPQKEPTFAQYSAHTAIEKSPSSQHSAYGDADFDNPSVSPVSPGPTPPEPKNSTPENDSNQGDSDVNDSDDDRPTGGSAMIKERSPTPVPQVRVLRSRKAKDSQSAASVSEQQKKAVPQKVDKADAVSKSRRTGDRDAPQRSDSKTYQREVVDTPKSAAPRTSVETHASSPQKLASDSSQNTADGSSQEALTLSPQKLSMSSSPKRHIAPPNPSKQEPNPSSPLSINITPPNAARRPIPPKPTKRAGDYIDYAYQTPIATSKEEIIAEDVSDLSNSSGLASSPLVLEMPIKRFRAETSNYNPLIEVASAAFCLDREAMDTWEYGRSATEEKINKLRAML